MTRLEKIAKIRELLAKRTDIAEDKRAKYLAVLDGEEKKESAAVAPGGKYDPASYDYSGMPSPELALQAQNEAAAAGGMVESQKGERPGDVIDVLTGSAPTRLAIGRVMGAKYNTKELEEMLLGQRPIPVGHEIVDRSGKLKEGTIPYALASTALDVADPGMLMAGASLLKGGVKNFGRGLYRQSMKRQDLVGELAGKEANAFSDTLLKNKVTGNQREIFDKTVDLINNKGDELNAFIDEINASGKVVDPDKVLGPTIEKARAIVNNTAGEYTPEVKAQAKKFLEQIEPVAAETKYTPARAAEPEQVPAFFESELPKKKVEQRVEQYVDVDQPLTGMDPPRQQGEMAPEFFNGDPQQMQTDMFNDVPVPRSDNVPVREDDFLAQLKAATEYRNPGWALDANSPEGIRQFEMLSAMYKDPDIVKSTSKRAAEVPMGQQPLFNFESFKNPKAEPQAATNIYDQLVSQIDGGQQSMLRPSDLMGPAVGTPAQGGWKARGMQNVKQQLQNMAGDDAYKVLQKTTQGKKLTKEAARDVRIALEKLAEEYTPGGGQRLADINEELGNLLTPRKIQQAEALKEAGKNAVYIPTQVDTMLAPANWMSLAAKKAGQIVFSPKVMTNVGSGLYHSDAAQRAIAAALTMGGEAAAKNAYRRLQQSGAEE